MTSRTPRTGTTVAALMVLLAGWWALGPWVLLAVPVALLIPAVRRGVAWRAVLATLLVGLLGMGVLVGALLLLPAGTLPLPPGPGLLVTSGGAADGEASGPLPEVTIPQHPFLAANGRNSMHHDAYASDLVAWAGPEGPDLEVDTAWFGLAECATLAIRDDATLVGLCGDLAGPSLRLIDPESLRVTDTLDLPDRPDSDVPAWQDLCAGAYFYLDAEQRAVVATTDQRVLTVTTDEGLDVVGETDLTAALSESACLVALLPDWSGRLWFVADDRVARTSLVGFVEADGTVRTRSLDGERIANSIAVDEDGGVYVVSDHAAYRFTAGTREVAQTWRAAYDRGAGTKPGQLSQGSGTTPTLLDDRLLAITDNAEPRMNVLVLDRDTGEQQCAVPVFEAGSSATENSLVSLGDAVIVENNHGYEAPWSTVLGRVTAPGLARVDVGRDGCAVAWTSPEIAPTSVAKASAASGLLYAYTTRPSRWAVTGWYLTALDLRDGHTVFSRRIRNGPLSNNHYAAVTIAPDGSAYVPVLGGLVRVRDR